MSHDHTHEAQGLKDPLAQCADFLQGIVYLLDNELSETDVSAVRSYLDSCNPCFETYDMQRRVKELVARSCAETAPDELRLRITMLCREVSAQQIRRPN